jgi:hypothetical protein
MVSFWSLNYLLFQIGPLTCIPFAKFVLSVNSHHKTLSLHTWIFWHGCVELQYTLSPYIYEICVVWNWEKKLGFLSIHLLLSPSLFIFIPQIITMSRTTQNSRSQTRSNQFFCNKKEEEHAHSFGYVGYVLRRQAKRLFCVQ